MYSNVDNLFLFVLLINNNYIWSPSLYDPITVYVKIPENLGVSILQDRLCAVVIPVLTMWETMMFTLLPLNYCGNPVVTFLVLQLCQLLTLTENVHDGLIPISTHLT